MKIIFLFSDQAVVEVTKIEECKGSVVECLTEDRGVAGSSLTVGTACVIEQDTLSSA